MWFVSSQAPVSDEFPASSVPKKERDWSLWYLDEDEEREELTHSTEQNRLIFQLLSALERWLASQSRSAFVSSEQRIAWMPQQPRVAVSPDLYVLEPAPVFPPRNKWTTWNTWENGQQVPRFALEIVSDSNWEKDYVTAPEQYQALGVEEWLRIDLDWQVRPAKVQASTFAVFRPSPHRTIPQPVERHQECMYLDSLGLWIHRREFEVFLAEEREGTQRLLTAEQWAESEAKRADSEAKRAENEAKLKEEAEKRADNEAKLKEQAEERAALAEAKLAELLAKVDSPLSQ
jgi:Uma2 family endonuclease